MKRRLVTLLTMTVLMVAVLAASALPAMAFNTFHLPYKEKKKEVVPVENPPGPPTVSGGPTNFVFHCEEGGGNDIRHITDPADDEERQQGSQTCDPK